MTVALLYYGLWRGECLAVVAADWAQRAVRELKSWEQAKNVGDALALAVVRRTALPAPIDPDDYWDFAPDDPFTLSDCGAVNDGDWPGMPGAWTLEFLPEAEALGEIVDTRLNGQYLRVLPEAESALVALAVECGYVIVRDDELINRLARWR